MIAPLPPSGGQFFTCCPYPIPLPPDAAWIKCELVLSPGSGLTTILSLTGVLFVGRNLDEAAVGIAAIDRAQEAACALPCARAFLDGNTTCLQMRDHLLGTACGEKAQILAARRFMVGGEPFGLVGTLWPHIDLLVAEHQRCPLRLSLSGIEHHSLHAEGFLVPRDRTRNVV